MKRKNIMGNEIGSPIIEIEVTVHVVWVIE